MSSHRNIGPFLATMLVAGNMMGSGIFLLPATLASVGSITVVGWVIATAGALLLAAVLARLSQLVPAAAGPCVWAGDALGPYFGFQSSVLYWVSCWFGNLAIALAATGYLTSFFPALAGPLPSTLATVALIWAFTLLNILGPRAVCQLESVAAVGLVPVVVVAVGGWWFFDPQLFHASWNVQHLPPYRAIPDSLVLVFWAFMGLECAAMAAGVVENPRRNVPLATFAGVLLAGLIYLASCSVIMGLIPAQRLATSTAPFTDAVRIMLGPAAGVGVAVAALLKIGGTLAGWILVTAQIGKAGADQGLYPRILGRVDRRGIPVANLLLMAVITSVIAFASMSPTLGEQFGKLIEASVLMTLLVYIYACCATWHYARTAGAGARAQLRGYRPIAVLAIALCVLMIVRSEPGLLLLTAGIALITWPLYWLVVQGRLRLRRSPTGS